MKHIHGGNIYQYESILDFSANLNPLGMPEAVKEAAKRGIDASVHYPDPDCGKLRAALEKREGVPAGQIICGNGAAELIFLLAAARRPKRAVLMAPSFAEYGQALEAFGCSCVYDCLQPERGFAPEKEYLRLLTPETDMVFLCNPNNPTGLLTERDFLNEVLERCRRNGILLVTDECFLDFTGKKEDYTMVPELSGGGLFVLKAFTKLYAMAGLRLGYGMCADPELLDLMNRLRQPWSVSVPAQEAGCAALLEKEYERKTVLYVKQEREWLAEKLSGYPLTLYPGQANYLFFRSDITDLKERLIGQGILIRDCSNYVGLEPGYYRIAVRTRRENERLIQAMDRICQTG